MYDVIVVGARCAGSPTAMLLARQGYRVLLVDRATFPSDTISTHAITHPGVVKLKQWGLYARIRATNCPESTVTTIDLGDFPLTGTVSKADGLPASICPRRTVLDSILVDAAVEAGVELRQGYAVRDLVVKEDGYVAGIQGAGRDDRMQTEIARLVIGADGKHSVVARTVHAPKYKEVPPLMCWYYSYWTDLQDKPHGSGVYSHDFRKVLAIHTNDGLTCLAVGWPHGEFSRVRSDLENEYRQAVHTASPLLAEWLEHSTRVERYYGMADLPGFFRKPYGPGWALVGDAGYHKDPAAAQGISDAFRDADLLANAVHAGLSGSVPVDEALADYERRRNADAFPRYERVCASASFTPPTEETLRLRAALRDGDQADIDAYLSAWAGTIPRENFFNPDNLDRILGRDDAK